MSNFNASRWVIKFEITRCVSKKRPPLQQLNSALVYTMYARGKRVDLLLLVSLKIIPNWRESRDSQLGHG